MIGGVHSGLPIVEKISKEEETLKYFKCLFGDGVKIHHLLSYNQLDDYCEYHNITKKFVLEVIIKQQY